MILVHKLYDALSSYLTLPLMNNFQLPPIQKREASKALHPEWNPFEPASHLVGFTSRDSVLFPTIQFIGLQPFP
jgi:hypothetical protein